jgi:hypothetical protein
MCASGKFSASSTELEALGVTVARCQPNSKDFDELVVAVKPNIVIFDQFTIEEQFSWRVRAASPDALLVLDTQDLHFLRKSREVALGQTKGVVRDDGALKVSCTFLQRELASIHRSDHVLLVSEHERTLLSTKFHVNGSKLQMCTFFYHPANTIVDTATGSDNAIATTTPTSFVSPIYGHLPGEHGPPFVAPSFEDRLASDSIFSSLHCFPVLSSSFLCSPLIFSASL